MPSRIVITRIRREFKPELYIKVKKAMELASWEEYVKPGRILIKADYSGEEVIPGLSTSPWVLEAVIKVIKEKMPYAKITVGDSDLSANVDRSFRNWGIYKLCRNQNVQLVNLSKEKTIMFKAGSPTDAKKPKKSVSIPKSVGEADSIISIPCVKIGGKDIISCALRNQIGCMPSLKRLCKKDKDLCTVEANKHINVDFVIVDATVCLQKEEHGLGTPIVVDCIVAGCDRVAIDSAVCVMAGLEPKKVRHVAECEKKGIGSTQFEIKGATLPKHKFFLKREKKNVAAAIKWILPSSIQKKIWYKTKGKKIVKDFLREKPLYSEEFKEIMK